MRLSRKRERRDGPRNAVVWEGRFGRLGQPEWEWQPCTVEDVSGGGARLDTLAAGAVRPGDQVGISVERLGSTPVGIMLRGEVAHVTPTGDAFAIGVVLDFTTPQERRIAESLFSPS